MRYSNDELSAIIERELDRSLGAPDSLIAQYRQRNLQYYTAEAVGELAGPEEDERSRVVSSDVADTIEWMLPSIVRVFATNKDAMEAKPRRPEFAPAAKLAAEYLRHKFWQENNGFLTLYSMFKDALLQKMGFVKIWWDDSPTDIEEVYRGLLPEQVKELEKDGDVEVMTVEARQIDVQGQAVEVFDLRVKRTQKGGRCRIEPVPPEEMRIHRRARYGQEPSFIAHVSYQSRADLEAEGYDLEGVANGDEWDTERIERNQAQSDDWASPDEGELEQFRVTEAYIRLDQDKDGVPELRRVYMIGATIFEDEKVDGHPFVWACPNPMPHVFFGNCPADQAIEPQRLNTSLIRGLMDSLYLTVNRRTFAVEGQVNLDDLLSNRPGGVVRIKQQGAVGPLIENAGLDPGTWQMMEWGEQWRERRTGFTRYSQGMSPDALNPTATGVTLVTEKADQRTELIASVFAIAVREIFRKMLKCMGQYQQVADVVELFGQWVSIDPREWAHGYSIELEVGLGTGSKDRKAQALTAVYGMQQAQVPLGLPPQALSHTGRKFAEAAGLGEPEQYFPDPMPPQPPPPDPRVQVEQMKLQADAQKFQATQQAEGQKMQAEASLNERVKAAELEVQRQNDERDAARQGMQAQLDAELERQKMAFEAEQKERDRQHQEQMAILQAQLARENAIAVDYQRANAD